VLLEVWDAGATSDTIIGNATFSLNKFMKEGVVNEWVEVFHDQKSAGKVLIRSTFTVDDSKHI